MPIAVLMPALSPTMEVGNLSKWLVKEGDSVKSGQTIAEIETDKATMEVTASDSGTVAKLVVAAGAQNVKVNALIAVLSNAGDSQESITAMAAGAGSSAPASAPVSPAAAVPVSCMPNATSNAGGQGIVLSSAPRSTYSGEVMKATVREALRDAMAEEMRRDSEVFIMGEEVAEYNGAYKVTQGLLDEFGAKRVMDTPITEQGFAGIGVGAAFMGLKPIVEFMTFNFGMQAIDQIINSAAKTLYMSGGQLGCPIVFRGPNGAASRVGAQHSQCFASWYAHCPGLKVVAPYSAADAKGLLKAAIRDPNPVIFLENEIMYGYSFDDVPTDPDHVVPIGQAKVVREGKDVTITAYSIMVHKALIAAEKLAEMGIEAEVIDLRTIRPLDMATILESVRKTHRLVSVEESWPMCGIGSEMAAQMMELAFDDLDAPVLRVCAEDVPLPYAANLEQLALPQPEHIIAKVKQVCAGAN